MKIDQYSCVPNYFLFPYQTLSDEQYDDRSELVFAFESTHRMIKPSALGLRREEKLLLGDCNFDLGRLKVEMPERCILRLCEIFRDVMERELAYSPWYV